MASDTNLVSSWVRQIEVHPVARPLDSVVGFVRPSSDQFVGRAITAERSGVVIDAESKKN